MLPFGIEWLDEARADVCRLDKPTAMRIFQGILHYAQSGAGDIEPLHGEMAGSFRLRVRDLRVLFAPVENTMRISECAIAAKPAPKCVFLPKSITRSRAKAITIQTGNRCRGSSKYNRMPSRTRMRTSVAPITSPKEAHANSKTVH